ncbi:MAG: hypothetical protein WCV59_05465 [Parcubacteria group bacterium]|jgi:hypothetical protein
MNRKIGVSVVCMLPWSLGRNGLARATIMAHNAGFSGLQILPLRGWDPLTFTEASPDQIISFELAWNCGSLCKAILRHLHLAGEENPLFHDWLLFGKCAATERRAEMMFRYFQRTSMFITHDVIHVGVMEMHPELDLETGVYANYPHGLVWDTKHVIRSGRHGQPPVTEDWVRLLDEVGHNIRLIHVKYPVNPKMLKALAEKTNCPVIFEARPPLGNIFKPPMRHAQKRAIEWLKEKRTFLGYFFE